jgi:uncharacterized membrane protein YozB (DUF420 family)
MYEVLTCSVYLTCMKILLVSAAVFGAEEMKINKHNKYMSLTMPVGWSLAESNTVSGSRGRGTKWMQ